MYMLIKINVLVINNAAMNLYNIIYVPLIPLVGQPALLHIKVCTQLWYNHNTMTVSISCI